MNVLLQNAAQPRRLRALEWRNTWHSVSGLTVRGEEVEGLSIGKLLIVGALIVLLFGTNKLRTLGGDLGAAIKGFKKAMRDDEPGAAAPHETSDRKGE